MKKTNNITHRCHRRLQAITLVGTILLAPISGCKQFITVDSPPTNLTIDNVYKDDATAISALIGIYTKIGSESDLTSNNLQLMSVLPGLSADEIALFSGQTNQFFQNLYRNAMQQDVTGANFWSGFYSVIYLANAAIEGLNSSNELTPTVKNQLLGEAHFIRAFSYFYLVNLYGGVPLILQTNYKISSQQIRGGDGQVYEQIIADLKLAQSLLNENYISANTLGTSSERVRPNRFAASALLARVYLYRKNHPEAEQEASTVIAQSGLYDTVALNNVFLKNSRETLWAIQSVRGTTFQNTFEGRTFILPSSGPAGATFPFYLSTLLMDSFEDGDARKISWTGNVTVGNVTYDYAYKYTIGQVNQPTTEYGIVQRLAEVYLIRAEARAQQGNTSGAIADLNVIRKRAGLPDYAETSSNPLLDAILHERQVELFTEWGHRWFDLKRTGKVNEVMSVVTPLKGGTWDSRWALYPIPESELMAAPQLVQNPGYERN